FVDQVWTHRPHFAYLVTVTRPDAVCRSRRQTTGCECPKRINQGKTIVYVATIETVLGANLIIETDDVFAPVLWIVGLKGCIVGGRRVVKGAGYFGHLGIHSGNGLAVRRYAL